MNSQSTVDRETLQRLLASAFAVQESQIDRESLSAILEVQRAVASGKLDVGGAMHCIVKSARTVANASGVAIGLLRGHQLTYQAGSGTSAACVGEHVTASLTVSATKSSREILRVENAQADNRIEADICRQFGASALLILPIYRERIVAGVLDIRFDEPHSFQEREVRTYQLMAEQIEAAMFRSSQQEQKDQLAAEPSDSNGCCAARRTSGGRIADSPAFWMGESSVPSLFERCAVHYDRAWIALRELQAFQRSAWLQLHSQRQLWCEQRNWRERQQRTWGRAQPLAQCCSEFRCRGACDLRLDRLRRPPGRVLFGFHASKINSGRFLLQRLEVFGESRDRNWFPGKT